MNNLKYYYSAIKWLCRHRAEPDNRAKWRRMMREVGKEQTDELRIYCQKPELIDCPIKGEFVLCGECKYWHEVDTVDGKDYGVCKRPRPIIRKHIFLNSGWFCADGERGV